MYERYDVRNRTTTPYARFSSATGATLLVTSVGMSKERVIEWMKAGLAKQGKTQKGLAEAMGLAPARVNEMLKGARVLKAWEIPAAEKYLEEPFLSGGSTIPVVGYVGAGAVVHPIDDHALGGALEEIDAPAGLAPEAVALRVRGDSMKPLLLDGSVIIYSRHVEPTSLQGKLCVVMTVDGACYVKRLFGGAPGRFTLISDNAAPILDQRLKWAAPIDWIRPS